MKSDRNGEHGVIFLNVGEDGAVPDAWKNVDFVGDTGD